MRILQIDKFFDSQASPAGGVGTYVSALSGLLRRAGHEVLQFGCVVGQGPSQMPRFIDYTTLSGMAARGRGAVRILHDFAAARLLDEFLSRHRVDVAHVHGLYHHLTPSVFAPLRRRGIPIVQTMHDYRLFCAVRPFFRRGQVCTRCLPHRYHHCVLDRCAGGWASSLVVAAETFFQRFFRRYVQNVAVFLCPSRFMADVLRADGVPGNKITLLPNLIEPPQVPLSPRVGENILFVGRVSPEKGPELLLAVAGAFPDRRVEIVGDGPVLEELRRQGRVRGLANVSLPGHVPRDRLGAHYASAAVVAVTSRWFENSPYAMLEAMLAGKCVVAAGHGAMPEWIEDGRTGRLFAPGDAGDLVRVLGEVLADPAGSQRMGRAARAMVQQRHDTEGIVQRLLAIYRRVAS